ncbi:MAG: 16S rRNA (cytidine(1402)-2'-O)-methyltransferase, partial [Flavobacteriales bacterium]|nr:16S rRNA (cytidine(1402)-2'-O)-methyltransferase [Flavobacteriales bacterium]
MLYLVPTPIGNLGDITFRAIETLKAVDAILAEDTRNTGKLLKHYQIDKKLLPFHAHNEHKILGKILERLEDGEDLALVSDAGMPGISDPGFLLVRACIEADVRVESLPGATAFVPALVNSGFPCERFCFEGFLPHKKGRKRRMEDIAEERRTLVFYESPHRIVKTLIQLGDALGATREASVSRELTKIHEE